jgi:pterin-4a-carbinolamine dehydratase
MDPPEGWSEAGGALEREFSFTDFAITERDHALATATNALT